MEGFHSNPLFRNIDRKFKDTFCTVKKCASLMLVVISFVHAFYPCITRDIFFEIVGFEIYYYVAFYSLNFLSPVVTKTYRRVWLLG